MPCDNLWRAGHAHVGVLLVLSMVALRYVDETNLSNRLKWFIQEAILLPMGFFLSVLSPNATDSNAFIYLAYLVAGLWVLGTGLIRKDHSRTT